MNKCNKCGNTENLINYFTQGNRKYFKCRDCWAAKQRKYYNTEQGNLKARQAVRNSKERYPEKTRARKLCERLEKKPCIVCGDAAHKHHPDYSKPLEVIWLCPAHHSDVHRGRITQAILDKNQEWVGGK